MDFMQKLAIILFLPLFLFLSACAEPQHSYMAADEYLYGKEEARKKRERAQMFNRLGNAVLKAGVQAAYNAGNPGTVVNSQPAPLFDSSWKGPEPSSPNNDIPQMPQCFGKTAVFINGSGLYQGRWECM